MNSDEEREIFGDDGLQFKSVDEYQEEIRRETRQRSGYTDDDDDDDDPNLEKGAFYSEDEPSEEKRQRKARKRALREQESTLDPQGGKKGKKRTSKTALEVANDSGVPYVSLKKHGGMPLGTTKDGVQLVVALPTKLPTLAKAVVDRYGAVRLDQNLRVLKGLPNSGALHSTSRARDFKDVKSIVAAYHKGVNLSEYTVKLSLARLVGSKSGADELLRSAQRHHLLTVLPPFKAFSPATHAPHIVGSPRSPLRPFPHSLLYARVYDEAPVEKCNVACLHGFESVSGIRTKTVRDPSLAEGAPQVRRVRLEEQGDGTEAPLFCFRSCYSDVVRLFWFKLTARDIVTIHLLFDDLVPLSGVAHAVCGRPLEPVSAYFDPVSFLRADGAVPWRFGEGKCEATQEAPLQTFARHLSDKKRSLESHKLCAELNEALLGVLHTPLPAKEVLFAGAREPRRPERKTAFPDELLTRFLKENTKLAEPLVAWKERHREATEAGRFEAAADLDALANRYYAYIAGYLDWRYFMLPEMVMAALSVAYETLHPTINDSIPIMAVHDEAATVRRRLAMEERFHYRVPAVHVLFFYYRETCYEKYAAALLLWNFIGGKKAASEAARARHAQVSNKNAKPRRFRHATVAFEALYDYYGDTAEAGADFIQLKDLSAFLDYVRGRINDVYEWNLYPVLCHSGALDSDRLGTVRIDPASLDLEQARMDRAAAEERAMAAEAAKMRAAPETWDVERVLAKAKYSGRLVVRGTAPVEEECREDVEAALRIFDDNFTLVPESRNRVKGMHRVHFTTKRAQVVIHTFMSESGTLKSRRTTPALIGAYIEANRREARGQRKYIRLKKNIVFSMNRGTDLYVWHFMAMHDPDQLQKHGRQL